MTIEPTAGMQANARFVAHTGLPAPGKPVELPEHPARPEELDDATVRQRYFAFTAWVKYLRWEWRLAEADTAAVRRALDDARRQAVREMDAKSEAAAKRLAEEDPRVRQARDRLDDTSAHESLMATYLENLRESQQALSREYTYRCSHAGRVEARADHLSP